MSGLPISLALDDQAIEAIAERVAQLLASDAPAAARGEWLTVAEAAEYLRCRPQRVYDLRSQGRLQAGRDGSRVLFRRADLDAYLAGGA